MSKFTQGPWHYVKHSWSDTGVYDENDLIAMLRIPDDIDEGQQERLEEEQEAHARLIAAAPDLLEALENLNEEVAKHAYSSEFEHMGPLVLAASAAISKAKGESK